MIYLDSSVALAYLLDEGRQPPADFWQSDLCSSRLLEYEVWTRIHALKLGRSHSTHVAGLSRNIEFVDLEETVLARALEPFPVPVRTLDALHLATIEFLRSEAIAVELASYDARLNAGAAALRIPLYAL